MKEGIVSRTNPLARPKLMLQLLFYGWLGLAIPSVLVAAKTSFGPWGLK